MDHHRHKVAAEGGAEAAEKPAPRKLRELLADERRAAAGGGPSGLVEADAGLSLDEEREVVEVAREKEAATERERLLALSLPAEMKFARELSASSGV